MLDTATKTTITSGRETTAKFTPVNNNLNLNALPESLVDPKTELPEEQLIMQDSEISLTSLAGGVMSNMFKAMKTVEEPFLSSSEDYEDDLIDPFD